MRWCFAVARKVRWHCCRMGSGFRFLLGGRSGRRRRTRICFCRCRTVFIAKGLSSFFVGPFAINGIEAGEESQHLGVGTHFQQVLPGLSWKHWHSSAVLHFSYSSQTHQKMRVCEFAFWEFVQIYDQSRDCLALPKQTRKEFILGEENGSFGQLVPEFCGK